MDDPPELPPAEGRVVVVTGASGGIGLAITKQLVCNGFTVVAGIRSTEAAERLQAVSPNVIPLQLDVCEPATVQSAAEYTKSTFPNGIRGLVNNAGIAVAGPTETLPIDQWIKQYDINVFGTLRVTSAFLPQLRTGQGRLINIGSASAHLTLPFIGPYSSSKRALEAISDALRRELYAYGLRVVVIHPGQTDTAIYQKSEQQAANDLESSIAVDGFDYRPMLERLQQLVHRGARTRRSPDRVAKCVFKALTCRRPRARYIVGMDARIAKWIDSCFPKSLIDWSIARLIRNN